MEMKSRVSLQSPYKESENIRAPTGDSEAARHDAGRSNPPVLSEETSDASAFLNTPRELL
jgi:hypothetical protein